MTTKQMHSLDDKALALARGQAGWTEDRLAALRTLWTDGLSASQIARMLGGTTRNAVVGKVHRIGLAGRATPSRPVRSRAAPPKPAAQRPKVVRTPRTPAEVDEARRLSGLNFDEGLRRTQQAGETGGKSWAELEPHMCRWPLTTPSGEHRFCGARRRDDATWYCAAHAIASVDPNSRARMRSAAARAGISAAAARGLVS